MSSLVDAEGTVCFADTTNILIDAGNPDGLIGLALERAAKLLAAGDATPVSIAEEFNAYWRGQERLCSLCVIDDVSRDVVIAKRSTPRPWYIAADTKEALLQWTTNRQMAPSTGLLPGYVVALQAPPLSLLQPEQLRVRHVCRVIRELGAPQEHRLVSEMIRVHAAAILILTFPTGPGSLRGATALIARARQVVRGYRPGKISQTDLLRASLAEPVTKVRVDRVDGDYLLARGGAAATARPVNALVIGAGAVGGWIAQLLATSGVGRLGIIDNDTFDRDNVHRHVLGMESVGKNKAEALATRLGQQFPHQQFWFRPHNCVDVLSAPDFDPGRSDFIILATGNETLELRVSAALRQRALLMHVWLDPFDLGHHVFVDGRNKPGCFRCLFARDDTVGLHNRASFLEKGQVVTTSLAGCAGNFAQYTVQHALSAATTAVDLALSGDIASGPFLLSKFCSDDAASRLGFSTSLRAQLFKENRVQRTTHFSYDACEGCA